MAFLARLLLFLPAALAVGIAHAEPATNQIRLAWLKWPGAPDPSSALVSWAQEARLRTSVDVAPQPVAFAHFKYHAGFARKVAERVTRLAKLVGRENVIASTDCGFAQGPFYRRVHPQIMWAKLQAMVDGAKLATKELWGTKKKAAKKPAAKKSAAKKKRAA